MKDGILYITTNMSDIDEELDRGNVQVIDGTTWCAWNDRMDNKYEPSGVVALYICKLGPAENVQELNGVLSNKSIWSL